MASSLETSKRLICKFHHSTDCLLTNFLLLSKFLLMIFWWWWPLSAIVGWCQSRPEVFPKSPVDYGSMTTSPPPSWRSLIDVHPLDFVEDRLISTFIQTSSTSATTLWWLYIRINTLKRQNFIFSDVSDFKSLMYLSHLQIIYSDARIINVPSLPIRQYTTGCISKQA